MNSAAGVPSKREYRALLRADFHIFVVRCFMELNAAASFQPTPYIVMMAAKLQAVRDGRIKRLIVAVPPPATIGLSFWDVGDWDGVTIVFECDLQKRQMRAFNATM